MTTSQQYALQVAAQARQILTAAHEHLLVSIAGKRVFVMKYGAKSELEVELKNSAPTIYRAGRFTFVASEVHDMYERADTWLIVLR